MIKVGSYVNVRTGSNSRSGKVNQIKYNNALVVFDGSRGIQKWVPLRNIRPIK